MSRYSESTIRRKAKQLGYSIHKGFMHYLGSKNYPVWRREAGYNVTDDMTGQWVWGCYNELFDHLWSLDDVESFLEEVSMAYGLTF